MNDETPKAAPSQADRIRTMFMDRIEKLLNDGVPVYSDTGEHVSDRPPNGAELKVIESVLARLGKLERMTSKDDRLLSSIEEMHKDGRIKFKGKLITTDPRREPNEDIESA